MKSAPKKRLKKSEMVLLSLVVLGAFLLLHRNWIQPKTRAIENLKAEVTQVRAEVARSEQVLSELQNRAPASVEVQTSHGLLDKYVKSNGHFSNVITSIAGEKHTKDFTLEKLASLAQSRVTGYTRTLYSIETQATFISLGRFLEDLEDSSLLTEVESIEISRLPNELKRCQATIKLSSYVSVESPLNPAPVAVTGPVVTSPVERSVASENDKGEKK